MNCIREFHAYRLRESRDHVAVLTIQAVVGPAEDPDVDSACLSYRRHRRKPRAVGAISVAASKLMQNKRASGIPTGKHLITLGSCKFGLD